MNKTIFGYLFFSFIYATGLLGEENSCTTIIQKELWINEENIGENGKKPDVIQRETVGCFENSCCILDRSSTFFSQINYSLKVRIAAFWPMSNRFQKIYGDVIPSYQIEGGVTFLDRYQVWVNFDWIYKRGHSYSLNDYTSVNIGNLSVGMNILHHFSKAFTFYAGLGPALGIITIHNRSTNIHKNETKHLISLNVKSGFLYYFNCHYFADFFVDYLYQMTSFRKKVDVGGFKTGIGIGICF